MLDYVCLCLYGYIQRYVEIFVKILEKMLNSPKWVLQKAKRSAHRNKVPNLNYIGFSLLFVSKAFLLSSPLSPTSQCCIFFGFNFCFSKWNHQWIWNACCLAQLRNNRTQHLSSLFRCEQNCLSFHFISMRCIVFAVLVTLDREGERDVEKWAKFQPMRSTISMRKFRTNSERKEKNKKQPKKKKSASKMKELLFVHSNGIYFWKIYSLEFKAILEILD